MEQLIKNKLEIPIEPNRLCVAFGSIELAKIQIGKLQQILLDNCGLIILNGSFATGICANPNNSHFLKPFDQDRVSDLDLGIVDLFLFRHIPKKDIIANLNKSHGLVYPNGEIKDYLKTGRNFKLLFQSIREMQQTTNRWVDIKIYKNLDALLVPGKNYCLLANHKSVCF